MFTGLVREFGEVVSYQNNYLSIRAKHKAGIGDSIAVNGACLTVVSSFDGGFAVELSLETRNSIASENLKGKLHIEPAMRLSDRVEGHIVQGHIDTIGTIKKIETKENGKDFFIAVPSEYMKFIPPKGSIAVDGVSLTVNESLSEGFRLTIIPHTLDNSLFGEYRVGRRVNIETDILVRSLHHLLGNNKALSWEQVDKILAHY